MSEKKEVLSRLSLLGEKWESLCREPRPLLGIVGLGAVGSWVLRILISFGFDRFVLVDDDLLSESDFNRSALFSWEDVGTPKVVCAEKLVSSLLHWRKSKEVRVRQSSIGKDAFVFDLFECEFVFDCLDGLNGKATLIERLIERKVGFVSAGGSARIVSSDVGLSPLSEVRGDPLSKRLRALLRKRGVSVDQVLMVVPTGSRRGVGLGPLRSVGKGRERREMGSCIITPMAVAIKMVDYYLSINS